MSLDEEKVLKKFLHSLTNKKGEQILWIQNQYSKINQFPLYKYKLIIKYSSNNHQGEPRKNKQYFG